ncbi:VUT family protein [Shewanella sp. 10N.286.51.B8]|uniref:VUT family protein n=1 Tax=Shewanella sp. 10N.286.51.B8 TaxID=3229708 RepID=UPI00354E3154
MKFIVVYILMVVGINWGFSVTAPFDTPMGPLPPMTFLVGIIFVIRDYAQRAVGHKVLPAMLVASVISYFMADPYVAMASFFAFLGSEFMDWAVYTFTKRPFHQRVLLSSIVGTPVDTFIFLPMIGFFSWPAAIIMIASKMLAAIAVWTWYKKRA